MAQHTGWCFTSFAAQNVVPKLGLLVNGIQYFSYQLEQCPHSGKLHFQGYVEFVTKVRRKRVQTWFGDPSMHCETRMGTAAEAREYTRKEDTRVAGPWEGGVFLDRARGSRSDLERLNEFVRLNGVDAAVISEEWRDSTQLALMMRNLRALEADRIRIAARSTVREVEVIFITGPSRTGKTPWAAELCGGWGNLYKLVWGRDPVPLMDGYQGEAALLIDEFTPGKLDFGWLLQALEGYPLRCRARYGDVQAMWTKVVITTNWHPDAWFDWKHCSQAALYKRLKVWHTTGPAKGEPILVDLGVSRGPPGGNTTTSSPLGVPPVVPRIVRD